MANTTPRIAVGANNDNTGRTITQDYQTPAYASTIALVTNSQSTIVKPGTLTGAVTFTASVETPLIGDTLSFVFTVDSTNRTVTFGTGFAPSATLALTASKYGSASFMYNGAAWIETGRAVTA